MRASRVLRNVFDQSRECFLERVQEQQIGIMSLNRGVSKNALSKLLLQQMKECLQEVRFPQSQQPYRVVIITSKVPGIFCAGADLKERSTMSAQETSQFVFDLRQTFTSIENLPMPTISCLNGTALGGGLEMALATDLRVIERATNHQFGLSETSLAIIPGAGGTVRLSRLIGMSKAKELIYLAKRITADDCYAIGIANQVVDQHKGVEASLEIAKQICQNGPIAVQMAKIAIQQGMQMDQSSAMILEQQCYAQVIPTKDRLEGLQAFKEKRKPQYKGE